MTPLVGSVPFAPVPFEGSDGLTHLVYELSVTNFTAAPLTVTDVAVLDAQWARAHPLQSHEEAITLHVDTTVPVNWDRLLPP